MYKKYWMEPKALGRPAKFDRDQAVDTVMDEIWARGYEACSVKALSETLGITRSSFYNAFGSRDALFEEVLSLYVTRAPDHALEDVAEGDLVLPAIERLFREIARARAADKDALGCLAVNCIAELAGNEKPSGAIMEKALRTNIDRFERLLRQAARNGEIESARGAREKALELQSLQIGLNVLSKVERDERTLWAVAKQTLYGLGLLPKQ